MLKRHLQKSIYVVASLLVSSVLGADITHAEVNQSSAIVEWSQHYAGPNSISSGRSINPTSDGGYIAAGDVEDRSSSGSGLQKGYVIKTDAAGIKQWEQKLGFYYAEYTYGYRASQTQDGGYIVSGSTSTTGGRPHNEIYLAKLDANGKLAWEKNYGDGYTNEYGEAVAEAPDGGFVVTGYSVTSSGEAPAYVLKTDASGKQLWYKKFTFGDNQYFSDVIVTPDGNTLVVGTVNSVFGPSDDDASVAILLNNQGEAIWTRTYTDPLSRRSAFSIASTPEGGYILASRKQDGEEELNVLSKLDTEGKVTWEKSYNPTPDREVFTKVSPTPAGYALIGQNVKGNYPEEEGSYEVLEINKQGEAIRNVVFGGPHIAEVGKGVVTNDGSFIIPSQITSDNQTRLELVKLSGRETTPPAANPLKEIHFSTNEVRLQSGEHLALSVQGIFKDGTTTDVSKKVQYHSIDPTIATVDATGQVTAIKAGNAEVTASYQGLEARIQIKVADPEPKQGSVYLDSDEYSLSAGTSLDTLVFYKSPDGKVHDVTRQSTFKSSNENVAVYDSEGNIIGIHAGTAHVTATYQGLAGSASVQVVRSFVPKSLDLSE
ncbi:hypothetical protein J2Z69_001977 [Paenibacillus shirakamiensis]|uniref:BIG2 domain-containing protein n=1 Tax=Paenibacillus shirakamiensis TaxID=1265935 RepID=A0ABS4JGT7_9BACL|nr:Ig-like domain-containing protein [Paenibacillus shirakamiensis]MBP2000934.1 hypothetical protein [Paenibacillus shirakamiensis]